MKNVVEKYKALVVFIRFLLATRKIIFEGGKLGDIGITNQYVVIRLPWIKNFLMVEIVLPKLDNAGNWGYNKYQREYTLKMVLVNWVKKHFIKRGLAILGFGLVYTWESFEAITKLRPEFEKLVNERERNPAGITPAKLKRIMEIQKELNTDWEDNLLDKALKSLKKLFSKKEKYHLKVNDKGNVEVNK